MLFNVDFAKNTILSGLFFFLLIIDLYFLIPAVIAQIFKEAKSEIEIYPVIAEAKIRKIST